MFQTINNVFNETFLENIISSFQDLQNQLYDAMKYTNKRDVSIIQTTSLIKTSGAPKIEISKEVIISL